ncbi:SusC/RagA family TonB-linked outer membrane protein [Flavobacterium sp. GA093]|uniref:SusC/RagA family TonB-linked outer membrane protein n=1 Tax=Flavobacterium hydrocarbonoxydans TaxID=2683249 RepID=A0A6I4NEY6_9FLAO|nr:TonB-dependent receptor [Flavobacterium hydrocarbonoxydans]MWB93100.1 SusC/RagA family TonB-linked outer membrane protein [Flavobacterium hydrocarbonoxydans]
MKNKKTPIPVFRTSGSKKLRLILSLFLMINMTVLYAQNSISGTVKDSKTLETIIGATVSIKGTTTATMTNLDGVYTLKAPANSVIIVSYIGYESVEKSVGNSTVLDFVLKEEQNLLKEVVVVGYGTQKKANLTSAISNVGSDIFENKPVTTASQALQGTIAGVVIQQGSSEPGQGTNINIRGIGTFQSGTYPLILIDGLEGSIDNINPNDIESVSVLKDASSAAVYGSRAANGVILITTKMGKSGKTRIAYDYIYGFQKPTNMPKYAKAWEYAELRNEALINSGLPAKFTPDQIRDFKKIGQGTVWIDEIYRDLAPQSTQNLSIEGGGEKTSYHVSVGHVDQESLFEGNDDYGLKRNNARINIHSKLSEKLNITASGAYNGAIIKEHAYWTNWLIEQATRIPVIYPVKDENGNYTLPSGSNSNGLARLTEGGMRTYQNDGLVGSLTAEWSILKDLKIKGFFGVNLSNNNNHEFRKSIDYAPYTGGGDNESSVMDRFDRTLLLNSTLTLNYNKRIGENHSFTGLLGISEEKSDRRWFQVRKIGIPGNEFGVVGNGEVTDESNTYGSGEEWGIQSYFGRINYSYDDRYLLEANVRADGSSRFSSENRWGVFPSFSGAWRISKENFMESVSFLSNLKIRASWGQVGNQDIGLYRYLRTVSINTQAYSFYDNLANAAYFSEVNQNLSWETSEMLDFGIDASFFNNKLSFALDLYSKNSKDVLVNNLPVPGIYGGQSPTQNIGTVNNKGWEFSTTYLFTTGKVKHSINANIADNVNEVTDDGGRTLISGTDVVTILKNGFPINSYYGLKSDGFFQNAAEVANGPKQNFNAAGAKPGDIRYVDRNGDGVIKEEDDRFILGNPYPRYTYGLTYTVNWNGLDLSIFLQGVGKRSMWIRGEGVEAFHNSNEGPVMDYHIDRWTPQNPDAEYPRLTIGTESANNAAKSDFWIQDASYLRLKNVQLGYTIPSRFTEQLGVAKFRAYITGQNLLTFTKLKAGYDPEINSGEASNGRVYPVAKVLAIGLNVNF